MISFLPLKSDEKHSFKVHLIFPSPSVLLCFGKIDCEIDSKTWMNLWQFFNSWGVSMGKQSWWPSRLQAICLVLLSLQFVEIASGCFSVKERVLRRRSTWTVKFHTTILTRVSKCEPFSEVFQLSSDFAEGTWFREFFGNSISGICLRIWLKFND